MDNHYPSFETRRIAALRGYEILDTSAEQPYDDVVFLASQICDTPIALISLVDENRQWFKAKVGLDANETPRDQAFCAHAILEPTKIMEVEDATKDPRFSDNPLVTGAPDIKFYAGVPLVAVTGEALGTVCVIDREPRTLTMAQVASLKALARLVMSMLEMRRELQKVKI
jgi:GAF domain-containing protein